MAKETSKELARLGATVVLEGGDVIRAEDLGEKIEKKSEQLGN